MEVEKNYQIRVVTKLNELVTRIDELKEQADNLDSEKQEEFRQKVTKIDAQTKATGKKLEELERGEYETQRILKTYLEHSLDDLKSHLDINLLPYF
jgi:hypothetical protein